MEEAHQQKTQLVCTVHTYTVNNLLSRHHDTFGSQQWILVSLQFSDISLNLFFFFLRGGGGDSDY